MQDKINIEEVSNTKFKISIQVAPENVDKKFDSFFENIKSKAEVPGFRKGKAPVSRVRQLFGQRAKPNVSQMLIDEYYTKALKENGISPVGNPTIENMKTNMEYPGEFGFDNSYCVDLLVEVLPKIDPVGYNGMELDFPKHIEDDLFNARMMVYQEQFAEHKQITERGAQQDDSLVIDFNGFMGDTKFDGGSAQGFSIDKLGRGSFIPGFEDQMVGMKPGETRDVIVTFPTEYRATHLAGNEARFEVTVQSIVETTLANVDDDLAIMVGHQNVDELIERVKEETKHERKLRDRQMMDHMVVTKLIEENQFDAPETLVEGEKLRLLGKAKLQSLPPQAQEELSKMALYNVKRAMIMDAIYEKEEEIEVAPDQLNDMLEDHAKRNNQTKDELVSNLYNSNQMDNFVGVLRLTRVMDYIIDHAKQESEEDNGDE